MPGVSGQSAARERRTSAVIASHRTAVAQHMAFDFFHQFGTGQAGGQGVRGEVEGVDLDDVVVRAVTHWRAWAHVMGVAFAVGAADAFERGFGADTGRDLVGGGLDAVVNPVIHAQAFLPIRVVHDDRVALGTGRAGVPAQRRRLVLAAATRRVAGGGRSEQAVVRHARDAQGEALLGLCRELHAKGHGNGRQPWVERGQSGHSGSTLCSEAVVGPQTIAVPFVPWH